MTLWEDESPKPKSPELLDRPQEWAAYQVHILAEGGPFLSEVSSQVSQLRQSHPEAEAAWIAAFEVIGPMTKMVSAGHRVQLNEGRIVIRPTELTFLDISKIQPSHDPASGIEFDGEPREQRLPKRPYLLIILPVNEAVESKDFDPQVYRRRVETILPLVIAVNDRNVAFKPIFENIFSLTDETTSAFTDEIDTLQWRQGSGLAISSMDSIKDAIMATAALPPETKRRITLSLRWFGKSRLTTGTDSFLNLWIALETLAMPDTTNILPVLNALASAYCISVEEARERFQVGRIFNFRGRIVHDGERQRPSPALLLVLESIYVDVLKHLLQLRHTGEAVTALESRADSLWETL